jgi:tetratricopeptide (TPR) repeat protein
MPAAGGEPRLMTCNTNNMNSWHSWSPNSKWLVFSSKNKGPYTQLYLTHIDETGNDSPPVFIENLTFSSKAANIPEFVPPKASGLCKMVDDFSGGAIYLTRLADLSWKDDRYKDALKYLEDAIKADSSDFDAYKLRIDLNFALKNSGSKEDLRYRRIAADLINKQIRQDPRNKSLYVKRGQLRFVNDDFEGALRDAESALQLNAKDFDGYKLLSDTYENMGQIDKAISYRKKMLELNPDDISLAQSLALLYHMNNQTQQGYELLNELIAKHPRIADLYVTRVNMMPKGKDLQAVKADLDRAIAVEPDYHVPFILRSSYYNRISMADMAKQDLTRAIELLEEKINKNPQNAPLLIYYAQAMEQMGDVQRALSEYESYLKSWPVNHVVLVNMAKIYTSQKLWQKVIDTYTTIFDNFPDATRVLFDRSLAYEQSGNLHKALDDLNVVIRSYPEDYSYYYYRSRIKKQLGDQDGYVSDLKTIARILKELSLKRKLNQEEQDILASIQKQFN